MALELWVRQTSQYHRKQVLMNLSSVVRDQLIQDKSAYRVLHSESTSKDNPEACQTTLDISPIWWFILPRFTTALASRILARRRHAEGISWVPNMGFWIVTPCFEQVLKFSRPHKIHPFVQSKSEPKLQVQTKDR